MDDTTPLNSHSTDIQMGDEFLFRGVTGEPGMGDASKHEIKVVGMTMWGDLIVKERTGDDPDFRGHGYQGHTRTVRYADALLMVDKGIWIRTQAQGQGWAKADPETDEDPTEAAYISIVNVVAEYSRQASNVAALTALMKISEIIDRTEGD